jgi:metalloendopeptidase OMA1, mitochondrial
MMKRIVHKWAVTLITAVLFIGCATVTETGRKQINFIPAGQEMQLGLSSFQQMKKELPISRDPAANALLQKVGKRIASVATLPNAQWEFVVFDSPEANAFCLPGGKVGVYKGLLPITRDEAGLATVIGHEVAHAAAHHGAERMSQATLMQTGGQLLGSTLSSADPRMQQLANIAYGLTTKVGLELPHDRKQEAEADQIGLAYMARAGYNPEEALRFWERFAAYNQQSGRGGGTPAFLRTHPTDEARIAKLKELLPGAQAEYAKAFNRIGTPLRVTPTGRTP